MQGKFIFFAVPCIAVFTFLVGLVTVQREENMLLRSATQQGLGIARISAVLFTNARIYEELDMVDPSGMSDYLDYFISDVMRLDSRILYFMVLDQSGKVVAHNNLREYGRVNADEATRAALAATEPLVTRHSTADMGQHLDIAVPLAIGSKHWGACRIGLSLREMQSALARVRAEVVGISALLLLTALALMWYAGRHFSRPLTALTQTMNEITERGDLSVPLAELPSREDEIGALQASFLWMVQRLRDAESERLRSIEGMHQTEKLATIGQLAAGVAHEINNPLGGVILCFRNLITGEMDPDMRREHERVIEDSLEKIRRIVGELMRYARPGPLAVRPTRVAELFSRILSLAEFTLQRRQVRIVTNVHPDVPSIVVDPDKMGQTLLNLVLNGADAMPGGGTIFLDAWSDGDSVSIRVRDTGPGVPEQYQSRIFDPFFTTKPPGSGTGLGLAVSASIVQQHGGTLRLECGAVTGAAGETGESNRHEPPQSVRSEGPSVEGAGGAAFIIRLPVSKGEQ